jgi:hypothetical protein
MAWNLEEEKENELNHKEDDCFQETSKNDYSLISDLKFQLGT